MHTCLLYLSWGKIDVIYAKTFCQSVQQYQQKGKRENEWLLPSFLH